MEECVGAAAALQRPLRIEAEEEHVGAGIDGAQRAIDLETVDTGLDIEALRKDHLKGIAGADVLLGALDSGQKLALPGAKFNLELAVLSRFFEFSFGQGQAQVLFQFVEALDGAIVGGSGVAARDIGCHDEPDFLAHMVEGQHLIEKEQAGVGNAELVFGARGQALDLAHGIVREEADSAGSERGQARQARGLVAAERVAQHGEDVALHAGGFAALGDGDFAAARHDALERREADEGVAAHLLAALDRFQEKALALAPGGAQEGRNRGFEVGHERAANGDERVRPGQSQELLARGLGGAGRGFHSFSVTARGIPLLRGCSRFRPRFGHHFGNRPAQREPASAAILNRVRRTLTRTGDRPRLTEVWDCGRVWTLPTHCRAEWRNCAGRRPRSRNP